MEIPLTDRHYASDELVRTIQNGGAALSGAAYVYNYEEADKNFYAILHEISWIVTAISKIHNIQGQVRFAIVGGSNSPYQVTKAREDTFVILIDQRAFYYLLNFIIQIQSLPPLSRILETNVIEIKKRLHGSVST